jgi:dihydroneopterin aldolase
VDRILLSGIRVRARHGVSDAECAREQEFVIDLACAADARAAARDDELASTIDYVRLRDLAVAAAREGPYRLVETIAERIACRILDELVPAWVRVRVTKVDPPGLGIPASVEIERGDAVGRSAPVELHVADFAPAKRFYGALGFAVAREERGRDGDGYLVMTHGADVLRFWPGTPAALRRGHFGEREAPVGHRVEIVLTFPDLDAALAAVGAEGTVVEGIRRRHWGLRDFRMLDPYGFYVRCTEPHDPTAARSLAGAARGQHPDQRDDPARPAPGA